MKLSSILPDGGLEEVQERIAAVVKSPGPTTTRKRTAELAAIKWFLATADGKAAGFKGNQTALVELENATIFDGRDNEVMKKAFYEAVLKVRFYVIPLE